MTVYDIIIEPVLSEKSYDGIAMKRYTFKVAKNANIQYSSDCYRE